MMRCLSNTTTMTTKVCSTCGVEKPRSEFYKDKRVKGGLKHQCRSCQLEAQRVYQRTSAGKASQRRSNLKHKYGITPEEYDQKLQDQKGCCAICGKHQTEFKKILAVDHNHTTGEVRDLLCHSCNVAIGLLQDDPSITQAAANYLNKHST